MKAVNQESDLCWLLMSSVLAPKLSRQTVAPHTRSEREPCVPTRQVEEHHSLLISPCIRQKRSEDTAQEIISLLVTIATDEHTSGSTFQVRVFDNVEPNPESRSRDRVQPHPGHAVREREEEDTCEGWAGLRGGLLWPRRRASRGGPDPSAQSHQNPSWWVLKSIRKCQGPGKENVTLEKTGRVGLEPPDPRRPAKPLTLGWQGCGRGRTWTMSRRDSTTRFPNTRPMDCGQRLQGNRIRK